MLFQKVMILVLILVAVIGFVCGYLLKKYTVRIYKGPSSSSVQRPDYSATYRFEPEVYVCPPSIDPDKISHSEASDSSSDDGDDIELTLTE